ncbi:CRE-SRU-1 protein [Caenorhabditis remanei]|uniref:CRE-SRU-1 protein n=1 Tax=Caenorhabditis remanei TaxID=31234 RepID=E3ND75_CAERE|nr:CRE-SRU-1 protein [Caenorhabditis remanei]
MSIPPDTIHFNQSYLNYHYEWNGFPTILAFVPWIYMLPTLVVTFKITAIYFSTDWDTVEPGKNQHVFLVISLVQISCFLFFLFNYLLVRLPATGLFTSYCAGISPNSWLLVISFLASYTNYLAMVYPFFMPVVRLMILMHPKNHNRINSIMMMITVPFGLIYPICFTFFLFPAIGTCKQLEYPYPFGSIWIYYSGPAFGLRNTPFFLANLSFWLGCSIIANILLFIKIAHAREQLFTQQTSGISYKAQVSITYTTIAMIVFYVTNGLTLLSYYLFYGSHSIMAYTMLARPFGNDAQACLVSWIFYRTHPVFKKNTDTGLMFERRVATA